MVMRLVVPTLLLIRLALKNHQASFISCFAVSVGNTTSLLA